MAKLCSWRATRIDLIGDEPVDHLVKLSGSEKDWLERPPTPPRPSLRPRCPPDLWDEEPSACGATVGRAREESPPPRKKGFFLSDHFGLLAEFVECTESSSL